MLRQLEIKTIKEIIRHIFLSFSYSAIVRFGRMDLAVRRARVHFLHLHHVFDHEKQRFHSMLQWLQKSGHTFISYSDAIERCLTGKIEKPYIAFSFDDGQKSCLNAGRILREFGTSACFFLNDYVIDNSNSEAVTIYCQKRLGSSLLEFLSWADVELLMHMGHEIGGHTTHHINMAKTARSKLEKEVLHNLKVLQKYCGTIRHFAWPYGQFRHFNKSAEDMVYRAGYTSCASGVRGCHTLLPVQRDFYIRREHCVASWPLEHIAFFLARSASKSYQNTNSWRFE